MIKIEDFENAPVGATATHDNGRRAMKTDKGGRSWILQNEIYLDDVEMAHAGYLLDPFVPWISTAREALDLAWVLAHPVKEGQDIPKGTRFLEFRDSKLKEYTAQIDFKIGPKFASITRTLDPLPDPEPDWLNAPAVLATCGCRGIELWQPHDEKDGLWVSSARGEHALWSVLRDVTPLYPKGQEA